MATISFDVPNAQATRVLNAFAQTHGYQAQIPDEAGTLVTNPENKTEFLKRKIRQFVMESVQAAEAQTAAENARKAAIDNAANTITLT